MSDLVERLRAHVNNRGGASIQNGAWQMMLDAADQIEQLQDDRRKLDKRIHNQRVALRENWETIEMRASYRRAWYPSPLLRSIMMRSTIRRKETWWKRLLSYGTSHFHS